jgi:chromosome segregation ATPase
MTPKLDDRIAGLEDKLKQLRARQARLEARKRSLASRRARKDDTRRKILIGAVVQAKVDQGVLEEAVLRTWLDAALTRAEDRVLFDLPVGGG